MNSNHRARRAFAFIAAAGMAASLLAPSAAFAANWSDENIAYARGFIGQSITMLQQDDRDYGGHRAGAVSDLNGVESDLSNALAYDANHDRSADTRIIAPRTAQGWRRNQGQSNENLEAVDGYLQSAVSMLQQDQHDYGGWRVRAIAGLEQARGQIREALAYENQNGPADSGSDRNMRYARWFIERGIDQLQNDQHDYSGHRVDAMNDMQQARQDILQGLHADESDPRFSAIAPPNGVNGAQIMMRGQNGSNENLEYVRGMVSRAIRMLDRDAHDYDGYRVRAIGALGQARQQLNAALASAGENGRM
ncbi:MAG TPA: hypothetical protein VGZ02_08360 [Candidatus Baltobacteraceae bacterium]|jgi:hypothetical protein|nr:hypothetical protein [Candidatus Baltobacteraceae bacterium]